MKKLVADLSLDKQMLQEVLKKNSKASGETRIGHISPRRLLGFYSPCFAKRCSCRDRRGFTAHTDVIMP